MTRRKLYTAVVRKLSRQYLPQLAPLSARNKALVLSFLWSQIVGYHCRRYQGVLTSAEQRVPVGACTARCEREGAGAALLKSVGKESIKPERFRLNL